MGRHRLAAATTRIHPVADDAGSAPCQRPGTALAEGLQRKVIAVELTSRPAPLIGIAAAAAGFAAFGASQAGPGTASPGKPVIAFYVAHRSGALTSDYLWGVAFACFLLFAASLRGHLRTVPGEGGLATLSLVTAAVATTGAATYFGLDAALATSARTLSPPAAQGLNVLALNMFLPLAVGGLTYGIATGVAIIRSGALPRWLAVSALVVGASFASPAGVVAVPLLLLWAAIAGVYAYRRPPAVAAWAARGVA